MFVLFENSCMGYALFEVIDEEVLENVDQLSSAFSTPEGAASVVKLKAFQTFQDTHKALAASVSIDNGQSKLEEGLEIFLKTLISDLKETKLAVGDLKLGQLIKEKLDVTCIFDDSIVELLRGIRENLDSLLSDKTCSHDEEVDLCHSLSRCKMENKSDQDDKVDTMIVQAIALLDELEKELNTYVMRIKEWYGWHFPEMGKIVVDNIQYVKVVQKMGFRNKCKDIVFSDMIDEDVEVRLKEAAEVSMGTEISDQDMEHIWELCNKAIEISDYRAALLGYLKNRKNANTE